MADTTLPSTSLATADTSPTPPGVGVGADEGGDRVLDTIVQPLIQQNFPATEAQPSPKEKEKFSVSRNTSPPDPNPHPIDEDAVHQAQNTILASTASDEFNDDGYNSDGASGHSTSLDSAVDDYIFSHGRRYHRFREGAYHFPNDDIEQEREDMKHAMVVNLCGDKLHFAPLEELDQRGGLQKVIDLGTGTGIWAIDSE